MSRCIKLTPSVNVMCCRVYSDQADLPEPQLAEAGVTLKGHALTYNASKNRIVLRDSLGMIVFLVQDFDHLDWELADE